MNQATKQVLPLDDADLSAHLLRMCPAKWQTQYDLTEKTTPVITRALLLILEKIENNAELEAKPPSAIKPKGAEGECKMESIDSRIPKKSKQVGFSKKHCSLCKKHGGPHKLHNTHDCRNTMPTVLLSKGMGVQVAHERTDITTKTVQTREITKGQIMLS